MTPPAPLHCEACERNKGPILAVLRHAFAACHGVLEIGSGTGQHAVHFARGLEHLVWQPTEVPRQLAALNARIALEGPPNLRPAVALDVLELPWRLVVPDVDAVFTANTFHIMPWAAVRACFQGVGQLLPAGGIFCVYGPFVYDGAHTSASNAAFDEQLRARDPRMGLREVAALAAIAGECGLAALGDYPMPANNRMLLWLRGPSASAAPSASGAPRAAS